MIKPIVLLIGEAATFDKKVLRELRAGGYVPIVVPEFGCIKICQPLDTPSGDILTTAAIRALKEGSGYGPDQAREKFAKFALEGAIMALAHREKVEALVPNGK